MKLRLLFIILWLSAGAVFAEEVNEDDLFGDTETVTDNKKIVDNETMNEKEKKTLGISGEITSVNTIRLPVIGGGRAMTMRINFFPI